MLRRVVKTCRIHQERVQIRTVVGRSPGCAAFTHQQMSHCEHFMLVRGRIAVVSRFLLLLFVNDGDIAKLCEAQSFLQMFVKVTLKCTMSAHVHGRSRWRKVKTAVCRRACPLTCPHCTLGKGTPPDPVRGWTPAWCAQHLVPFNPFQHGCVPATFITTVIWPSQKSAQIGFWRCFGLSNGRNMPASPLLDVTW